jgi:hypothetical protein
MYDEESENWKICTPGCSMSRQAMPTSPRAIPFPSLIATTIDEAEAGITLDFGVLAARERGVLAFRFENRAETLRLEAEVETHGVDAMELDSRPPIPQKAWLLSL